MSSSFPFHLHLKSNKVATAAKTRLKFQTLFAEKPSNILKNVSLYFG